MVGPATSYEDVLRRVLLQEKELVFKSNAHLSEKERQQLWDRRIQELTSTTGLSTLDTASIGTKAASGKRSRTEIPRTMPSTAPPSKRRVSVGLSSLALYSSSHLLCQRINHSN
jgi:hypothetical protein